MGISLRGGSRGLNRGRGVEALRSGSGAKRTDLGRGSSVEDLVFPCLESGSRGGSSGRGDSLLVVDDVARGIGEVRLAGSIRNGS